MENNNFKSTTVLEEAINHGWADKLFEDTENYYKRIIRSTIPYLEKYMSSLTKDIEFDFKENEGLIRLIHTLKSESYGAK